MTRRTPTVARLGAFALLAVAGLTLAGASRAETPKYVREILRDAKRGKIDVRDQVIALIGLAWPREGERDPQVMAAARQSLVEYGHSILPTLRRTIPDLDPLLQADATATFIEARFRQPAGMPQDFLPGLDETIWYASIEAKRVALAEVPRYDFPPAVLGSIDAAYAHPRLARYVIHALGQMGDLRARLFLKDALTSGAPFYKQSAAKALVLLGGNPVNDLRASAQSDQREIREASIEALLPLTEVDDLTLLHDYVALRTEDDPALLAAIRERAIKLERELAEQQASEAASESEEP